MNNVKDRLDVIIGYSAVIISLSAFKSELNAIQVDLSFSQFTLADYLLWLIVGFVAVLHIYALSYFLSTTKFFYLSIFKYIEVITYSLFGFILLSPVLLLIAVCTNYGVIQMQSLQPDVIEVSMRTLTIFLSIAFGFLSNILVARFRKAQTRDEQNKIEEEGIKTFETAQKLINDGYYLQSIVESYKILENNIYKILKLNKLAIRKGGFNDMLNVAFKYRFVEEEQLKKINEIRILRNDVVHLENTNVTKDEAERTLAFVKDLVLSTPDFIPSHELEGEEISRFFAGKVFTSIGEAKKVAEQHNKPLFIIIYDGKHPKKSKLDYSLGYFTEYETTKKIIKDNFVQALIDKNTNKVDDLIPIDEPLENCLLVIVDKGGQMKFTEGVYANPDEGLKRVRHFVQQLE